MVHSRSIGLWKSREREHAYFEWGDNKLITAENTETKNKHKDTNSGVQLHLLNSHMALGGEGGNMTTMSSYNIFNWKRVFVLITASIE